MMTVSTSIPAAKRSSNIELLRIVAMLAIVAHHYVVNSTVTELFDPFHPTANSVFLQLWGMWGKTAINVFVLITGYFMCQSRLTMRRYLKMLLEIVFYSWVIWFVLAMCGYEAITWKGTINRFLLRDITSNQNDGFVPGFMWMYLMIPAMNVYLQAASKRNLYLLLTVLLMMFTFCGTFLNANVYHHVFWYLTLYLIGATIRKYPFSWMNQSRICLPLFAASLIMAVCSVVVIDVAMWHFKRPIWVWKPTSFVSDSHKLFALMVSVSLFLVFKNWKFPQSRFVNTVASTTFGVLLIHAASDGMRKWLWQDFVNVPAAYSMSLPMLIGYSVVVMVGVFAVCSALDYLRIRFVERPVFKGWGVKV